MSTSLDNSQTTKVEITLTQAQKQTLEKAASIRCLSLDEYLLEAALNLAEEQPLQPESIVLSDKDWQIVTTAIENPPKLNPSLKAAIKRYKEEYQQK
ncbi:DUF1778 domain-containing protein [Argonema galeatum]|uniref:type II toxin-antitoxin system TacA family antitoxin n=1 Tax=Argonema galeatum TaxID=2942762 RepID=UPI0020124F75|nr:DUF1778 domain-containing protein [Argonema galeatum]MCL1467770.1 DUF1778 domain-containing protein [Argonema galeatum A003/A1]